MLAADVLSQITTRTGTINTPPPPNIQAHPEVGPNLVAFFALRKTRRRAERQAMEKRPLTRQPQSARYLAFAQRLECGRW
jgi:hypothetical protein